MTVLLGILFILGGAVFAISFFYSASRREKEERLLRVPGIDSAQKKLEALAQAGQSARCYVELRGVVSCGETVTAPFSDRPAAYYEDHIFAVYQLHGARRAKKEEQARLEQASTNPVFLTDREAGPRIQLKMESFRDRAELMPACDRFEEKGSSWVHRNAETLPDETDSPDFLGYRLTESVLLPEQPLRVLGELTLREGRLLMEAGRKRSYLTCRQEERSFFDVRRQKHWALIIGIILILIGIVLFFIR